MLPLQQVTGVGLQTAVTEAKPLQVKLEVSECKREVIERILISSVQAVQQRPHTRVHGYEAWIAETKGL